MKIINRSLIKPEKNKVTIAIPLKVAGYYTTKGKSLHL
jgi:hypothetical protein